MKRFLLFLGAACMACNGSASRPANPEQSAGASTGGVAASNPLSPRGTTVATPSAPRLSTVTFGGIDGVDMSTPLVLAITETEYGSASQVLNYAADDGHVRLVFALDYDAAANGAQVALGGDTLADIRIEQLDGYDIRVARAGSYTLQQNGAELLVSFNEIRMATQGQLQPDNAASLNGSVRGNVERRCAFLGAADPNGPNSSAGQARKVLTSDPSWSSAFCAQHR